MKMLAEGVRAGSVVTPVCAGPAPHHGYRIGVRYDEDVQPYDQAISRTMKQ